LEVQDKKVKAHRELEGGWKKCTKSTFPQCSPSRLESMNQDMSPLPPQKSGIGRYSVELLRYLAGKYDIEIFIDDGYIPDLELLSDYSIHHCSAFDRRSAF
jgi:hypothetical protein